MMAVWLLLGYTKTESYVEKQVDNLQVNIFKKAVFLEQFSVIICHPQERSFSVTKFCKSFQESGVTWTTILWLYVWENTAFLKDVQNFVNGKTLLVAYYYKIVAYYYNIVVQKTAFSTKIHRIWCEEKRAGFNSLSSRSVL